MPSLYAGLEKGRPYILSVLRIVVALLSWNMACENISVFLRLVRR
jgi:hypothetical protein